MVFPVFIFTVLSILSVGVFFPSFIGRTLPFSTLHLVAVAIIATLAGAAAKPHPVFSRFLKVNSVVFPVLGLATLVLFYLEFSNYPNFVFSRFGVELTFLSYLFLLSGTVFYAFFKKYGVRESFYYLILPSTLVLVWIVLLKNSDLFTFLVKEDGPLEYLQLFLYLASSITAFKVFLYFKKSAGGKAKAILFFAMAVGFLFVAQEEISWGQRILGIETPDVVREINLQDEITVHNLNVLDRYLHPAYMAVGLYGSFSGLFRKFLSKRFRGFGIYTTRPEFFFCFFSIFAFYFIFDFFLFPRGITVYQHINIIRWQEVFETYLAFGFFGYISSVYRANRGFQNSTSKRTQL
jgi:hypothetical protein